MQNERLPILSHFKLPVNLYPTIEREASPRFDRISYVNVVGNIKYSMVCTKLDIRQLGSVHKKVFSKTKQTVLESSLGDPQILDRHQGCTFGVG